MNSMNRSIAAWLLGGALVASLGWNAARLRGAEAPGAAQECGSCAESLERMLDRGDLSLAEPRRVALQQLMRECDATSAANDARAAALSRDLRALLRDPAAEPAAIRARGQELAAVRAAAVQQCVDSALALRDLLSPAEAGRVLDACCGEGCCGE